MEDHLGHLGPIEVAPLLPMERGEGGRIGGGVLLLLGRPREGTFPPTCGAPSSPPNLYILELLALFYTQVLEPPLVDLVLVLVGPS